MIFPTIHLNGTSAQELLDQIDMAHAALIAAREELCKAAPNARDYYVQPGDAFGQANREHHARLSALNQIILDLSAIGENIYQQQEARKKR